MTGGGGDWAEQALDAVLGRVAVTRAEVGDRFPLFADPGTGHWTTTRRGSWAGGFWAGLLWLRARHTGAAADRAAASECTARLAPWAGADTATRGLILWYGTALADGDPAAADLRGRAAEACHAALDPQLGLVPWGSALGGPRLLARSDAVPGMVPLLATTSVPAAAAHLHGHLDLCLRPPRRAPNDGPAPDPGNPTAPGPSRTESLRRGGESEPGRGRLPAGEDFGRPGAPGARIAGPEPALPGLLEPGAGAGAGAGAGSSRAESLWRGGESEPGRLPAGEDLGRLGLPGAWNAGPVAVPSGPAGPGAGPAPARPGSPEPGAGAGSSRAEPSRRGGESGRGRGRGRLPAGQELGRAGLPGAGNAGPVAVGSGPAGPGDGLGHGWEFEAGHGWMRRAEPGSGWSRGRAWLLLACADGLRFAREPGASAAWRPDRLEAAVRQLVPMGPEGLAGPPVPAADEDRPEGPLDTSAAAITAVALLKLARQPGPRQAEYARRAEAVLRRLATAHLTGPGPGCPAGMLLDGCYDAATGTAPRHELVWGDHFLALALAALTGLADLTEV
ncbi:hypothetical protein [Streptomyces venezuelae]|uniref:hypothetical protein n=1 Tax=Streptomyces venezuelae TaxID=54571 RepID=UPI00295858C8|nr:hypothetical protein [Streptomyces venezuelae]